MKKLDKVRWSFLRLNIDYQNDFDFVQMLSQESELDPEVEEEFKRKWGISELFDYRKKEAENLIFLPKVLHKIFNRNELIETIGVTETPHTAQPIEINNPVVEMLREMIGNSNGREKKYVVLAFDVDMFSNIKRLNEAIEPILKKEIDYYNSSKVNTSPSLEKIVEHLKYYDVFEKELGAIFNEEITSMDEVFILDTLSKRTDSGKLFETILKGTELGNNPRERLFATFRIIRNAPFFDAN